MTEQYAWRFREWHTGSDILVVGCGSSDYWDDYGERTTIVTWGDSDD